MLLSSSPSRCRRRSALKAAGSVPAQARRQARAPEAGRLPDCRKKLRHMPFRLLLSKPNLANARIRHTPVDGCLLPAAHGLAHCQHYELNAVLACNNYHCCMMPISWKGSTFKPVTAEDKQSQLGSVGAPAGRQRATDAVIVQQKLLQRQLTPG